MSISKRYAFGDFVMEPSQRRLSGRNETPLTLSPRLFAALQLLVERAGVLLGKDELVLALWWASGMTAVWAMLAYTFNGIRFIEQVAPGAAKGNAKK